MAHSVYDNLTAQECVDVYTSPFVSGHGPVVILSNNMTSTGEEMLVSVYYWYPGENDQFAGGAFWMCSSVECLSAAAAAAIKGTELNLSVPAMPIMSPTDNLTRTPDGKITSQFHTACTTSGPLCSDLTLLDQISWFEPWNLETALHTPNFWRNSTWAADIGLHQGSPICSAGDYYEPWNLGTDIMPQINYHYSLDGCLSARVDEHCRLMFSPPIWLIVIGCGFIKMICMFLTTRLNRKEVLLTTGDAIASFLSRPDPATDGRCLMARRDMGGDTCWKTRKNQEVSSRRALSLTKERWMVAAGLWHWIITLIMYCYPCHATGQSFNY
jgi:hypothetical protein